MTLSIPTPGTDLGLPAGLTRRALLSAVPVLALPAALGAMPTPGATDTPIMRLFRERAALTDHYNVLDGPEAETTAIYDRRMDAERAILREPPTTIADLAAEVLATSSVEDHSNIWEPELEAQLMALVVGRAT